MLGEKTPFTDSRKRSSGGDVHPTKFGRTRESLSPLMKKGENDQPGEVTRKRHE